jgi:uncharacterized damage-inducible protein DinB
MGEYGRFFKIQCNDDIVMTQKIVQLLEYNHFLRKSYFDTLAALPWAEVVKNRGASFDSLRNIFLHCIAVFEYGNKLLRESNAQFPQINYEDYNDIEKIRRYQKQVEEDFNEYLSQLTPDELARQVTRRYRDGRIIVSTVEDNLLHFLLEETHHHGEFIALLWQLDINPPHFGWINYLQLES